MSARPPRVTRTVFNPSSGCSRGHGARPSHSQFSSQSSTVCTERVVRRVLTAGAEGWVTECFAVQSLRRALPRRRASPARRRVA
jgi:hypothetical protein